MKVDGDLCISCWMCVSSYDKLFRFDDDNKAELIKQPETEQEIADFQTAKENCPVWAIQE